MLQKAINSYRGELEVCVVNTHPKPNGAILLVLQEDALEQEPNNQHTTGCAVASIHPTPAE